VEGTVDAIEPGSVTHPPLVRVQAFTGRPPEIIELALRTVAGSVANALGIPADNVFVHYEELALRSCVLGRRRSEVSKVE